MPPIMAQRIAERLQPLVDVGLSYIKLGQSSSTLSGGESQRVKLAYFLSMNETMSKGKPQRIMFIFDEPTTGLHFHDIKKLLAAFNALVDKGHTIIVVEHNPDVIRSCDHLIDMGPDGGRDGGTVVATGTPEEIKNNNIITLDIDFRILDQLASLFSIVLQLVDKRNLTHDAGCRHSNSSSFNHIAIIHKEIVLLPISLSVRSGTGIRRHDTSQEDNNIIKDI